jgi:hypothetical protein
VCLFVFACVGLAGAEPRANWTANYPPCNRHSELLKHGPMNLGVRVATANPLLAEEFKAALDFWAKILDLDWHEDDSQNCSIQLADGSRKLFEPMPETMAARSQFPDRRDFQGWIVFNPAVTLDKTELYRISVHEIGHMLGLHHNPNTRSFMYDFDLDCSESLDATDLASLSANHKLRAALRIDAFRLAKPQ